jgi:hypothetical protein
MKKKLCFVINAGLYAWPSTQNHFYSFHPDKAIAVNVNVDKAISYAVSVDKMPVLSPSTISMATTNGYFGKNSKLKSSAITAHQGTIKALPTRKIL